MGGIHSTDAHFSHVRFDNGTCMSVTITDNGWKPNTVITPKTFEEMFVEKNPVAIKRKDERGVYYDLWKVDTYTGFYTQYSTRRAGYGTSN